MSTALIFKTNCLNDSLRYADSSPLKKGYHIDFNDLHFTERHVPHENRDEKCSVASYVCCKNNGNNILCNNDLNFNTKTIKIISLISFLHSLRLYFKKKINIYFCDKCLDYFNKVILLQECHFCENSIKRLSSFDFQVSQLFNFLYSICYPLEPKAHIMGCICTDAVYTKRPYIKCGCVYSYHNLDHDHIFSSIVNCETKILHKTSEITSMKYIFQDIGYEIIDRIKEYKSAQMLPFHKFIFNCELYYLHVEFYKSCISLFELLNSHSPLVVKENIGNALKAFNQACSTKVLIFQNIFHLFKDLATFFNIGFFGGKNKISSNFKCITNKTVLFFHDYSEFFLLFGFFNYCHKILKLKRKSLVISKLLLKFVDSWLKKHILNVLLKMLGLFKDQCSNNTKTVSANRCNRKNFNLTERYFVFNKYLFLMNDKGLFITNNSMHSLVSDSNIKTFMGHKRNLLIPDNKHVEMCCSISNDFHQHLKDSSGSYNRLHKEKFIELSNHKDISYAFWDRVSTGKEELDVVDGVNIFSFESESDMIEFTRLQNKHSNNKKSDIQIKNSGRIMPTKTRDITKIKGWRNKLFCLSKNDKEHVNSLKGIQLNIPKYKSPGNAKVLNSRVNETQLKISEDIKRELCDDNAVDFTSTNESEVSLENVKLVLKGLDHVNVPKNVFNFSEMINAVNNTYLEMVSEGETSQILTKFSNKAINCKDNHQGVFQSSFLDDYLERNSKLKVSFEISMNGKPQPLTDNSGDASFSAKVEETLPSQSEDEPTVEKVQKISSMNFIRNIQGDISKKKFILVHGRPIMIEHESKKTSPNCSTKKQTSGSTDDSMEDAVDSGNEVSDLDRSKVIKQLKFPDSLGAEVNLNEAEKSSKVKLKPPYLSLLNTSKTDEVEDLCEFHPDLLSKQKFPLIFPCKSENEGHRDCSQFDKIQLVMVINIGYKRPLLSEVMDNLEKLKKKENIIDELWAYRAASAVDIGTLRNTVKRFIVPVVSESLIEVVKFNMENVSTNVAKINELNVKSVYRSICASNKFGSTTDLIGCEIKDVVKDIIEYVVKRDEYEMLTIPYDPDVPNPKSNIKPPFKRAKKSKVERELERLINVTFVDESNEIIGITTGKAGCKKDYCLKGCICNSLDGKLVVSHCGKQKCMFECSCDSKINYSFNNSLQHRRRSSLAKDESSWHQTVICKNNEVEVKAGAGKSKREKKLPTRYRNNVLLGNEMNCLDFFPFDPKNTKKSIIPNKIISPNKDKHTKVKNKELKKDKQAKTKEKRSNRLVASDMLAIRCDNNKQETSNEDNDEDKSNEDNDEDNKESNRNDKISKQNYDCKVKHIKKACKNEIKETKKKDHQYTDNKSNQTSKQPGRTSENNVLFPIKKLAKKVDIKQKALISANLKQILNEFDVNKMKVKESELCQLPTLADMFVWCTIHFRYSCSCCTPVFALKNNRLVWKATANRARLSAKLMSQIVINKSMTKCHIYNREEHSARTFGSIFLYKLRNSNPVFRSKRMNEILNNVTSNTNSFIKIYSPSIKLVSFNTDTGIVKETGRPKVVFNSFCNETDELPKLVYNADNIICNKAEKRKRILRKEDGVVMPAIKKKYRIGPAHFDSSGSYKAITMDTSPKRCNKPKPINESNACLFENETNKPLLNEVKTESYNLPKYGLLCLTQGFGYLPIKEFTNKKLQVQDPLSENVFHCFKDIESANKWLNRFFKNRIVFESLDVNLKWVIVKPGILKNAQPFDRALLVKPTKIVDKYGCLVDITNVNVGNRSNQSNLSKRPLTDNLNKRHLDAGIEAKEGVDEIPSKKLKKFEDIKLCKNSDTNQDAIVPQFITKPVRVLQKTNPDCYALKSSVVSSPNVFNSRFIRLNSSSDSSTSNSSFIPILPIPTPKEPCLLKRVNGLKPGDKKTILVSKPIVSNHNKSFYTADSKTSSHVIVSRLVKPVSFNIKSLPGKSILKTNLSKM